MKIIKEITDLTQNNRNISKKILNQRTSAMVLMILGSGLISFTGLIIRDMDFANALQINLYRGLSLSVTILIIFILKHRSYTLNKIIKVGKHGFLAGALLALAGICLIQSITTTTVASTLFICASIPFITSLFAFIFLNERISKQALITMVIAGFGVCLMMFSGLKTNSAYGVVMALITAISFSGYAILIRKNKGVEMLPCVLISGLLISSFCLVILKGNIDIYWKDLARCVLLGSFISLIPSALFIYASRYIVAGELTLFMLLEFSLGPFWVWVFINEVPAYWTLAGGSLVMISVIFFVWLEIKSKRTI